MIPPRKSAQAKKEKVAKFKVDFKVTAPSAPSAVDPNRFSLSDEIIDNKIRTLNIAGFNEPIEAALADYRIVSKAGVGTHGQVSKVELKSTGIFLAMKEMELDTSSPQCMRRIMTELDILKHAVECPQIVTYYGSYCHLASIFIIMELMELGSLDIFLNHGSANPILVPEYILASVCVDTITALEFLHTKLKIIHRDIKPSNLLLNSKGQVKLCDFSVSGQLVKSCARTYVGTMYYMAPERIQPLASKEYTPKADVWSLGVTLVELALGRYPFPKEPSPFKMLVHIVEGVSPAVKLTPDSYSALFIDFVSKCVKQQAGDRLSYSELLTHEFVAHPPACSDIVSWISAMRPDLMTS